MPSGERRVSVVVTADATSGVNAFNSFATAVKATSGAVDAQAKKIVRDFEDLKKTAAQGKVLADQIGKIGTIDTSAFGKGIRNAAEAALQGAASPLSTFKSSLLSQLGGAEGLLSGISTKTVVAGAAVAGLTAGVAFLGVKAVQSFTSFADKVDNVQDVLGGTAEQASVLVNWAEQWGVQADTLATGMARLAVNLGKNSKAFADLGIGIARTKDGSVDLVETTARIADAYNATNDPVQKATILQAAYGKAWIDMVDVVERGGDAIRKAGESAKGGPIVSDQDLKLAKEWHQSIEQVKQEFTKVATEAAPLLIPVLQAGLSLTKQVVGGIEDLFAASAASISVLLGVLARLPDFLGGGKFDDARDAVDHWRDSLNGGGVGLDNLKPPIDTTNDGLQTMARTAIDTAQAVTTLSGKLQEASSAWTGLTDTQRAVTSSSDAYAQSLDDLDSVQQKNADAQAKYSQAVTDGAQKVAAAQKDVADAQKDVADAQAGYAKAVEDGQQRVADAVEQGRQRVEDAAARVADVEEQSSRRVVDAQQKVIDARKRADDQLKSSARRVDDARQALADALSDALREGDTFDAMRKREDAQKNLTRAEEDYASDQKDSAKSVADAQSDLAQTEKDAAKDRADAQKDLRDAQTQAAKDRAKAEQDAADQIASAAGRVVDAQDRVTDASGKVTQAMQNAQAAQDAAAVSAQITGEDMRTAAQKAQGLADNTFAVAFQMRESGASMEEIQPKIDASKAKVEALGAAGLISAGQVAQIKAQLDLIPHEVDVQFVLHLSAQEFLQEMRRAGQQFAPGPTRDMFNAGIIEVVGGAQAVPHFAGGGVFRAPSGGAGLAVLHDREAVFTPDQLASLGGGGGTQTIVLQVDGRELARVMADGRRRGTLGFG